MATCPECDAEVEIDDDDLEELQVGDTVDCNACASRLRVATLRPLEFDVDDDDDDDDDDDAEEKEKEVDELDDLDDDDDDDDDKDWDE
jgi:hypothetical protein